MSDFTGPKIRKPFRGRRPRRPANPNQPAGSPENSPGLDGDGGDAGEQRPPAAEGAATNPVVEGAPEGADGQRPPRPPRPQRPHKPGRPPPGGPAGAPGPHSVPRGGRGPRPPRPQRPAGPVDPDAQPFFDPRGPRPGDSNHFGKPRGAPGGQPPWAGKGRSSPFPGNGPDRGGESRRGRDRGPQFEEPVKLSKLLGDRGLCTPREADSYIQRGWVIVNGERASGLGMRVHPAAEIRLAPEARGEQSRRVTILLNKPAGAAAAASTVAMIRPETLDLRYDGPSFHPSHLDALAVAGPADDEVGGLVVLTQDDRVAQQLLGTDAAIEEEYLVRTEGVVSDAGLDILRDAGEIDGEAARPRQADRQNDARLRLVFAVGQPRRIDHLCELAGVKAVDVQRVRIGHVRLGDLRPGQWRYLRDDENF